MANGFYDPWAGLPQVGANIGQAIQQKGQQRWQTMLQQMQQEQQRRYQESLPQYKIAEQQLRDMGKQALIAANFVKAQSEITPFLTKFGLDKIFQPKEEEKLYGMASQYPSEVSPQLYSWLSKTIEDKREAESRRGLREAQRIGALRPPTGGKVGEPSIGENIRLYDRAKTFLYGITPDYYQPLDKNKQPIDGPQPIPGTGEKGFLEEMGLPARGLPIAKVKMGPFQPGEEPIGKMWQEWDKRKLELPPEARKIVEDRLISTFGPKETGVTQNFPRGEMGGVYQKLVAKYGKDRVEGEIKRWIATGDYGRETAIIGIGNYLLK